MDQKIIDKSTLLKELLKLVILNGQGDPDTEFTLVADGKRTLYRGPVTTSRRRTAGSKQGTRDWLNDIFVSDDPDPKKAFDAAFKRAQDDLQVADPWSLMGSSTCGRNATVHVIDHTTQKVTHVPVTVTRMNADNLNPIDDRPRIIGAVAWKAFNDLGVVDRIGFNTIGGITCALEGDEFEPLKP